MNSGITRARLVEERKQWRQDHPHGFWARPEKNPDGTLNLLTWKCGVPGKDRTNWGNAVYPLTLMFPTDYPSKPPKCRFTPPLFHPNVYPSGAVCLSILNENADWKAAITVKQILIGIQDLLDDPNPDSPAQSDAYVLFKKDREQYEQRVLEQAANNRPHLPSFRRRALSLSSLNVPRRYHLPITILQYLCLIPSLIGFLHHLSRAWSPPLFDTTHLFSIKSTPLVYSVANLWCLLAGYWSWLLTTSMVRRWLYQYEVSNAVIRLVIMNGLNWTLSTWICRLYGPDQPVVTWMVICGVLLLSNVCKLMWTAATSVDSKYRGKAAMTTSPPVSASSSTSAAQSVVNGFKLARGEELHYKSTVVRVLVLPLTVVVFVTMFAMLYQIGRMRASVKPVHMDISAKPHPAFAVNNNDNDNLRVMVAVLSAWTPKSIEKRITFRETTMQLIPDPQHSGVTFHVQFIIGQPPTDHVRATMGTLIDDEIKRYNDVLMLDVSDKYEDLSQKVYGAMEWMDDYQFDYLMKTDDDIFLRWDTISQELKSLGPQERYWQGLAYWNIPPIRDTSNKNSEMNYPLPLFPPYTAGALYIVSRDVVHLIAGVGGPRLFVKNEDQNLGIWLFPYNIRPIHDRRIQQIDACEEDMIAKHFGDFGEPGAIGGTMQDMLANLQQGRRMCQGFRTSVCAMCYPCHHKGTNWREWNFDCHHTKGVTLLHPGALTLVD